MLTSPELSPELNMNTLPKSGGLCEIEMADFLDRIAAPAVLP
jgi:hypothetical protein